MTLLQAILAFLLAIGALITVHEFGHYWVARRCGVRILRFSIGFGRPLWRRRFGPDNAELVVAMIPLGGYVKMLDGREEGLPPEERSRCFGDKSLAQRSAIVLAGPLFNFLFAIAAYTLLYLVGETGLRPLVDEVAAESPASQAGFLPGDEITAVNGRKTPTWKAVANVLVVGVVEGESMPVEVRPPGADQSPRELQLDLAAVDIDKLAEQSLLTLLGIEPVRPAAPAVVGEILSAGAAARDGFKEGDRIVAANGEPVEDWPHWVQIVQASPGAALAVEVKREGQTIPLTLTPAAREDESGETLGYIGAAPDLSEEPTSPRLAVVESYPLHTALAKGVAKTAEMSVLTLSLLAKMVLGDVSTQNLSGPIRIAQYAGETARLGPATFLTFLALISISLGVLNLLPIPMLDGGHLLYFLVEFFKGSPVSDAAQLVGLRVGMALLLCLIGFALYNDVLQLLK